MHQNRCLYPLGDSGERGCWRGPHTPLAPEHHPHTVPCRALCHAVPCCVVLRCAELAIGNIVRRVLHIVREEAKHEELSEHESAKPEVVKVEAVKQQAGLLSQALRVGNAAGRFQMPRGASLRNLLDVGEHGTAWTAKEHWGGRGGTVAEAGRGGSVAWHDLRGGRGGL